MTTAELKLDLFRKIDNLEVSKVKEAYGVLLNFINNQNSVEDWEALPNEQKQGIINAEISYKAGKGISHAEVLSFYKK